MFKLKSRQKELRVDGIWPTMLPFVLIAILRGIGSIIPDRLWLGPRGRVGSGLAKRWGFRERYMPAGIGTWTDGEVVRLITTGVTKDGKAIFPLMPYPSYGQMSQEDVYSIVAYLRTLAPVEHTPQKSSLNFPMNLIVRTIPQPYTPQVRQEPADTLAYGAYMTTISGCSECHTQNVKGEPVPGMAFAGGFVFPMPQNRTVVSANITPDVETGIGTWTKAQFVERFKRFAAVEMQTMAVDRGGENTIMPWTMYAGMTEEDLGAIYTYLRTVDPVKHRVETYPNQ